MIRTKGSHHYLRNPDRPRARPLVPVHRPDLPPDTLRAIIRVPLVVSKFGSMTGADSHSMLSGSAASRSRMKAKRASSIAGSSGGGS